MDWASRGILVWSLKDNMSTDLCLEALEMAFSTGRRPQIFNTDQGSRYTSERWQTRMLEEGILISQDSKGRWADNIVMERFWRTYKHEFFLLEDIPSLQIAKERTARWLDYYNGQRAHSTLGNQSPPDVHRGRRDDPRTPFFEGLLRCGAALVAALRALAELGKPLLRSKFPQKMAWLHRPA